MKKTLAFLLATLLVFSAAVAVSAETEESSVGTAPATTTDSTTAPENSSDAGSSNQANANTDTTTPTNTTGDAASTTVPDIATTPDEPAKPPKPTSLAEATEGMKKLSESDNNALYLNEKTGSLRYISKKTLEYADTKIMDANSGNDASQNMQKSDVAITYISDLKSGALTTVDTFSMGVDKDGMTIEEIPNGVRLKYVMGETKLNMESFPQYVSQEKFERLVLAKLDYDQKETLKELYRLRDGRYTRTKKPDDAITQLAAKMYYNLIFEVGDYTQEDMEADNAEYGVELTVLPLHIELSVDYVMDGDDLIVSIPVGEIIANEKMPIQSINLMPYFMTGTKEQQGYMFVPDGSGALINLNSNKLALNSYSASFYGRDPLIATDKYYSTQINNITLPVYGMKTDNIALMGIIEEGAGFADLSAEISGKSDEFNRISVNFNVRPIERVQSVDTSNVTMAKWLSGLYKGNLQIRYKLLSGEDANYNGMANAYKQHLINNGDLTPIDAGSVKDATPLAVEMIGAIDRRKLFLGVSYDSTAAMTTFDQAATIIKDLKASGVDNIKVQYTGWMKGGLMQSALTNNSPVDSSLGNKNGFKQLMATASSEGIDFYPSADIDVVLSKKGFSPTKNATRGLSGSPTYYYPFENESTLFTYSSDYSYYLSPNYLPTYASNALNYFKKMGVSRISSNTAGSILIPDYNKNLEITREDSVDIYDTALSILSSEEKMMLSNPNAYAFKHASVISDLPSSSNNYKIFDASVPFLQMVLSGCIEYTTGNLNLHNEETVEQQVLQCVQTGATPKFVLTNAGKEMLTDTNYDFYLEPSYSKNKDRVLDIYQRYTPYYEAVKGSMFVSHDISADGLVVCGYSNGVKVVANPTSKALNYSGQTVEPGNYAIVN